MKKTVITIQGIDTLITISVEHQEGKQIMPVTLHTEEPEEYGLQHEQKTVDSEKPNDGENRKAKKCKWCGSLFVSTGNSLFCTDLCRREQKRKQDKEHKQRIRDTKAVKQEKPKPEKKEQRCKWCGMSFNDHALVKFCSDECRAENTRKEKREWYRKTKGKGNYTIKEEVAPIKTKRCLKCNMNFTTSKAGELFCSECRPKK